MKHLLSVLLLCPLPSLAVTYCVSQSTGNDSNNGISTSSASAPCTGGSAPWKTLAHVSAQTFSAGDIVLQKAGDTWRENLVMPSSGVSGNPITFSKYGSGANPLISGSVIETGWSLDAGSVYKKTPPLGLADQVFQDGVRLAKAASHGAIVAGSFFYDSGTTTLYVQMTNSSNPSGHTVEDDSVGSLINFNGKSWINVTSIDTIESANNGYDFQQVVGAHDIIVTSSVSSFNFFRGFSLGGYVALGTSNISFVGCTTHDNLGEGFWIGNGTNNGCSSCEAYNNGKDVANGYAGSNGNGIIIGIGGVNNYILKSYVHDTYFGFPIMDEDENHAGRVKPTGSLIEYNYILNNAATLTASAELEGASGVFAYNWIVTTASGSGKSIRMHSQGGVATGATNYTVVGNSFYQGVAASSTGFNPEATTSNFTFKNNKVIFATTGGSAGDAISWANGATGTSDYNSFQNTEFFWGATSTFPATLAAWKTACSCDAHSIIGSSVGYTSTVAPFNLALTNGAPEIDAGLNLGATYQLGLDPSSAWTAAVYTKNQNTFGSGWDIGAVVYPSITPPTPTFYVDPAGNDSNNGTSTGTPWKTVAKVNSVTFTAGQVIGFKSGGTWHEALSASHSGTVSQPITYTFYGAGALPVFDGADVQSTWTLEVVSGHNLYHSNTGTYPSDPTQVFQLDGSVTTRLTRAVSTAAMGVGSWFYDIPNTRVYIRTTTDDAPSNHVMEVSARTLGASTTTSLITNVVINGLHATRTQHIGLSATTVINSQSDYNYDFGIVAPYNNSVVQNNIVTQNGSSGISSFGTFTNFLITANTSHDNCQLAEESNQDFCAGIRFGGSGIGNGSVTNNESYANVLGGASSGRGIHFDTNAASGSTVTISGNKVHNNYSIGIIIEQAHNTSVQYNLAYSNGTGPGDAGIEIFRSTGPNVASGNVSWGNAIGYRSEGAGAGTQTNNAFTNNIGLNNSVRELTAKFGGENDGVNGSGNTYTFNSLGVQATNFIEWGSGVFKSTYAAFDTAYGSATHSITTDPLLVNPPSDFSLQLGSPAIDTGSNLGAGYQFGLDPHSAWTGNVYTQNQNSFGTGWDVGAYVFNSSVSSSQTIPVDWQAQLTSATGTTDGFIYAGGFLWAASASNPSSIFKVDPVAHTVAGSVTLANDGNHNGVTRLTYTGGKLYAIASPNSGDFSVTISQIDPTTLAVTDVIHDTTQTFLSSRSITNDGTNLYYGVEQHIGGLNSAAVRKWQISGFSDQGSVTLTIPGITAILPFGMEFDGVTIWITGNGDTGQPGFVTSVSTSLVQGTGVAFASGDNVPADELADTGAYIWTILENSGTTLRIKKSDLSITRIPTGLVSANDGMYYDGTNLWASGPAGIASGNFVLRMNPSTLAVTTFSPSPAITTARLNSFAALNGSPISNDWLQTLAVGQNASQAFIVTGGFSYVLTFTSPAIIIKTDLSSPSTRTTATFPSDGAHNAPQYMIYSAQTKKLYGIFHTVISEIDPVTLAFTDVVTGLIAGSAAASDSTYIYVSDSSAGNGIIRRYLLSGFAASGTLTIGGSAFLSATSMQTDLHKLYESGSGSNPAWIARVDLSSFTLEDARLLPVGDNNACDDSALTDSYLWIALEGGTGLGKVLRIAKNDFSSITTIDPGIGAVGCGMIYDGSFIWVVYHTMPGTLVKINPTDLTVSAGRFQIGQDFPNKLAFDATDMYFQFSYFPNSPPLKLSATKLSELYMIGWPGGELFNAMIYGTGAPVSNIIAAFPLACTIAITSPASGTVSGPTTFSATSTLCPSVVRWDWKINGQPLMGDGTYEYSSTVPTCTLGTCTGSYQMPAGFGPYNVSYNWDGVYPLTVQALDSAGNVLATSSTVNLTVTDYGLGGTCSLSAPNFANPQSGTINVTITCPGVSGSGVFANAWYALYIDGKFLSRFPAVAYPDHTFSFDTTTLENGKHLMWVSVTATKVSGSDSQGDVGNSPVMGAWGIMTTSNGSAARELRLNFNKCFLWLGGISTCSLSARTANDDNSEVATNATFTTSDAAVATVGSCTSVASCTITGVGSGVAQITATGTNGLVETAWIMVNSGTPIMPHFGTDGSYCTAYNLGNCAPNKSFLVRMMFDNADTTNNNTVLRSQEVLAGYNVFQHSVYPSPAQNSYPSFSSWQTLSHNYFTGAGGINAILASGFKAFMPSCASMFQDGQTGQSSSDGNGAVSDGHGFLARVAYLMTDMQGKSVGCLSPDEDPLPLIKGFGTGQMGTPNGPSQIVVSGGTATITWPAASSTAFHIDITGANNTCFNATNIVTGGNGTVGGPYTFSTGCGNGTYNSGTDPNLVISIYNELCPSHPCQSYGPLNIPIPNSILQTIQTGLHAATPPASMGFSWAGGAPKSIYQISASVADYTDIYFTWITSENWSLNRGYPSGRTVRMPLLAIENQFWNNAAPGMDRSKPFYQLTHTGDGSWFARGGKTFTLGATTGSQFTTTVANNAVIGSKITVTGATCIGNYFDVLSIQTSQTFTVSQSPACSGSGGTVVIAPTVNYFLPKLDQYKQPPIRGVENAAQLWLAYALGAAGNRTFQLSLNNGGVQYPCNSQNAYVDTACPPDAPNLEDDNTGNTYIFTDNPGATARWNSNSFTQNLINTLTPEIIQPLCNAPDLGQRVHTGAKCGPLGKLVIAISDSEVPTTLNFPASLWSLYNVGNAPVTRIQQRKAAYTNIINISGSATSDSLTTGDGGEIDIWFFPSGSTPLGQTFSLPFTLPAGATQTALRYSYLCDPGALTSNLDQNPEWTIGTSTVNVTLVPPTESSICYQTQFLDASNAPVGAPSAVQLFGGGALPQITTTSPLPTAILGNSYSTTLSATNGPNTWAVSLGVLPTGLSLAPGTGVISGVPTGGTTTFNVAATNSIGSSSATFTLPVISVPVITTVSPLASGQINVAYSNQLVATGTTPITWSVTFGSLPNGLSISSGGLISGIPGVAGTSNFTITAMNAAGNGLKSFSLTINPTPPVPPTITTTSPLPGGTQNVAYSTTINVTGTIPITCTITGGGLPSGLSLAANTCVISGTPTGSGTSTFTVTATNIAGSTPVVFSLTIVAAGVAPTIVTTSPLPSGVVGTAYSTQLAANGTAPITWTVQSGTIPTGTNLSSSGLLSGTPTVASGFSFVALATNAFGTNTKTFAVTINNPPPVLPVITTTSPLPAGIVNVGYSTAIAVTGTTPITCAVTVGSLPTGLTISGCIISGTPTVIATTTFTITASNVAGNSTPVVFSISIFGVAPTITTLAPLPTGIKGISYTVTIMATGTTPITWALIGGALPSGFSLNTSTGVISGTTSNPGTYNFTLSATNVAGSTGQAFILKIKGGAGHNITGHNVITGSNTII